MQFSKDVVASWAFNSGFENRGNGFFRGSVNPFHKGSVSNALKNMGLTLASVTKAGTEIWSSEDDDQVVLVKYS